MSTLLATSTGAAAFASAMEAGVSSDALWTEVTKFSGLMIGILIFAFGYYVVKKVLKGGSKGKFRA